ncbi:protein translocase subunit SecD [Alcaligenes aquatilis]|uniref:Protein translocase subunit SecD n=2 Tax=Alcaligenes TaxID=507 RepID=A0AB33CPM7_ALCFA|nr:MULTISPECIES: protein translocase subunit SecD [Alcaligenes]ASR88553.1 protein translocase subunit SecD [Alcaligenes faecalis]MCC9163742.1 protein translocase subunit SecD [Alcaligenes sp. MMA]QXR36662.1 protein translocase subunit SecD [Alcaligenes aquatilis]UQN36656.1 protein translocase subunit SecD [Alcaligenes aquatilis]UYY87946.1 protein translocase subunit SecD [Alcaligenes sp. SMD-FA]
MNRYPLWKYVIVLVALAIGLIYTLPNLFGESPAVQVSSAKSTVRLETSLISHVEELLKQNNIPTTGSYFEQNGPNATARFRFESTDVQLKAKDLIERELNKDSTATAPDYTVALNLVSASPAWLTALGAHPMHLGLDLRGGVHFLLQVDMQGALQARYDSMVADARSVLREAKVPVGTIERDGQSLRMDFASAENRDRAQSEMRRAMPDLEFIPAGDSGLTARLTETATIQVQTNALTQNITTLHNRINELGVAEPVIQQQGSDRIVVQLPGVQDVAKAKEILGRTATLELRMVEDSPAAVAALNSGTVPFGLERYTERGGAPLLLRRQVILTGENLQDAQPGRDSQTQQPTVNLTLDNKGSRIFRDITRNNINKRMAIVLFENGVGEVVTAPVIRSEIPNGQVQISGSMNAQEAADISLLLRAGSLAAPMSIIEERTIGPSLGADNIRQGFNATLYGFIAIAIFIMLYYHLIGLFSTIGLTFNVLLLLAVLSMLQATLTLPGIAAIALTLGMAIDANVLINERIREELRNGASPQQAIHQGFDRAWATIFDSNLTSLIVGVALLAFGSGPIRGFAVVHVIGILTSMFSSVVGVRALVNLWYGNRRRLQGISIGQVWKPQDKK